MELTEFWTILSANGIILEPEQLVIIERYAKELTYWNEKVNLISRKDIENLLEQHILHSISCLKFVEISHKARCIDVGSGGGLPGIPIKIARPDVYMILVDSIAKKIKITSMLAKHTNLRNIEAICSRVEDLAKDKSYAHKFDFAFARGVSKIKQIIEWVKPIIKPDGKIVLFKGGNLQNEIDEATKKFKNLKVSEKLMELVGYEKFAKDEKKIVVCQFN